MKKILFAVFISGVVSCNNDDNKPSEVKNTPTDNKAMKGSFGYDLHFLQQYHKDLVILGKDSNGAQVIIAPAYQGRVMTENTSTPLSETVRQRIFRVRLAAAKMARIAAAKNTATGPLARVANPSAA